MSSTHKHAWGTRGIATAAAVVATVLLAGCGGHSDGAATAASTTTTASRPTEPTSTAPSSTAPSTTRSTASTATSAPTTGSDDDEGIAPSAAKSSGITPVPHTKLQAQQWAAATRCADGFTRAFARRKHDTQAAWWRRVQPFLTDSAAEVYRYTQVSNVSVTKVTGKAQVRPIAGTPIGVALPVAVPTNVGTLIVTTITDDTGVHVAKVEFPGGGTS